MDTTIPEERFEERSKRPVLVDPGQHLGLVQIDKNLVNPVIRRNCLGRLVGRPKTEWDLFPRADVPLRLR